MPFDVAGTGSITPSLVAWSVEGVLEQLSAVAIGVSQTHQVIAWNRSSARLFGVPRERALGTPLRSECFWELGALIEAELREASQGRPVRVEEVTCQCRDGSKVVLGLTLSPVRGAGGIEGVLITGRDITQQKAQSARLAQQELMATLGKITAGVAHEINTPMQFMNDNLVFLKDAFATLIARQEVPIVTKGQATGRDELAFLRIEAPSALDQVLAGLAEIAATARALEAFAAPDTHDGQVLDLHRTVHDVLLLGKSHWFQFADAQILFRSDIGQIRCVPSELRHRLLGMLLRAADAAKSAVEQALIARAEIRIDARPLGGSLVVSVTVEPSIANVKAEELSLELYHCEGS